MVKRGEVWWYEAPYAKPRPHLVLTRDELVPLLSDILAMPATRTRRGIPTEVPLDTDDSMPAPSVLTADNLVLIERAYLTRQITALSPARMAEICEAIGSTDRLFLTAICPAGPAPTRSLGRSG